MRGPVSAAAMQARSIDALPLFRSSHCSADEYDAFLQRCYPTKQFVQQRRSQRKQFVEAWPDIEEWLAAPLALRVGRINGQTRATLQDRPSYFARAYLYYLALQGHLRLDYPWLLAVGDLCVHDVARLMDIDLGVERLAREATDLGLVYAVQIEQCDGRSGVSPFTRGPNWSALCVRTTLMSFSSPFGCSAKDQILVPTGPRATGIVWSPKLGLR